MPRRVSPFSGNDRASPGGSCKTNLHGTRARNSMYAPSLRSQPERLRRFDRGKVQDQREKEDMRTEATPDLLCINDYGSYSRKAQRLYCSDFSVCAQIVSKNPQEYQNVSKDIELYRNPGCPKNGLCSMEFIYFLYFRPFYRFLHTVEVRGSSPLSPIPFRSPLRLQSPEAAHYIR